jgi:hypothetical protein
MLYNKLDLLFKDVRYGVRKQSPPSCVPFNVHILYVMINSNMF